jgi:hypothetical protein
VAGRFAQTTEDEANRLIDELAPAGAGELRRAFAGPMAAGIVTQALGLGGDEVADVLAWYDAIVASVTEITAGNGATTAGEEAFASLSDRLRVVIDGGDHSSLLAAAAGAGVLSAEQVISNAAVLLFGGIETTEGMIANAALYLLTGAERAQAARAEPAALGAAIDESLRLEPAAAVVDRYAAATWCGCRSPRPTATRRCSPIPTRLTRGARTCAGTSPLPRGRTSASGCTWPAWRPGPRWAHCWRGCRGWRWTRRVRRRSEGSCSASRSGLMWCGKRPDPRGRGALGGSGSGCRGVCSGYQRTSTADLGRGQVRGEAGGMEPAFREKPGRDYQVCHVVHAVQAFRGKPAAGALVCHAMQVGGRAIGLALR